MQETKAEGVVWEGLEIPWDLESLKRMLPDTGITFDDVAGCDGAKSELLDVVDFLK